MKTIKINLNIYSIITLVVGLLLTAFGGFLSNTSSPSILEIRSEPLVLTDTGLVVGSEPRMITVTGQSEVFVVPDEVVLTLGVETRDKDLEDAVKENDEIVEAALKLVSSYDIDSDDIQTDYFRISPSYDYSSRRLEYYSIRKTFVIKLRDLSVFEDLLQDLLLAGVNQINGIEFLTSDLRSYKDEARALALEAAQEKANDMAAELGQEIGEPVIIQEVQDPMSSWFGGGMLTNSLVSYESTGSGIGATIAPGQIPILAIVTVSFELK